MKSIFVGNLSFSATEAVLRSLFEKYGPVERVSIATDREFGQPRGFGFVEMTNDAEALKAIAALNGWELDSRRARAFEKLLKTTQMTNSSRDFGPNHPSHRTLSQVQF